MSVETVKEYNSLVKKWNANYSSQAEGQTVSLDDFSSSLSDRILTTLLTNESTERQKIKQTVTTINDFAYMSDVPPDESDLTKNELAQLIVLRGRELLDAY